MNQPRPPVESLFWSIALPGLGQFLNGKYVKAIVLLALELMINSGSRLNLAIMFSFQGDLEAAARHVDYQWLLFYPCVYVFSVWDAYRDAGGGLAPYAAFPFVFCAFVTTVGIMYSSKLRLFGVLLGPVWLPMLFAAVGVGVGFAVKFAAAAWYNRVRGV